jgi:natural product biosynthesis luciferase-like monooxygenase protein
MNAKPFSSVIIGGDTLLMECGDILLSERHEVRAVVTSEGRVKRWAEEKGLSVIDARGEYLTPLQDLSFDYLFAITHLAIIPDEVLALPKRFAVNFHDGPLPAYAGLNAPVWALINGEREYGISWHVISPGVDEGDLLLQVPVDISESETALSLNTKCMAAAVESFPELVRSLAEGRAARTPQDLSRRSYYGKFKKPIGACAIDWSRPAHDVAGFVRALTYGPYTNPVGLAKLFREDAPSEPVGVTALELTTASVPSGTAPGTVIEASDQAVVVSTIEGCLSLIGTRSMSGEALTPRDLRTRLALQEGAVLGGVDGETGRRLTEADAKLCRHEEFWTKRLTEAEGPEVPLAGHGSGPARWTRVPLAIPPGIEGVADAETTTLAAFVVYLARTGRKERFTLAVPATGPELLPGWYSPTVPLVVDLDPAREAREVVEALSTELSVVREKQTYLCDLVLRQPRLAVRPELRGGLRLPVGVLFGGGIDLMPDSFLRLELENGGRAADIVFDENRLSREHAREISASVSTCLAALIANPHRRWCELDLVTSEERRRQTIELNATDVHYPSHTCLHELFEAQVDRTPNAVAVTFRDQSLTYSELDGRANALANHLQRLGVGPDVLVGVLVDRSLDLLVATLGVLKAGGAYVPLDPDFPSSRIQYMVADSGTSIVVAQDRFIHALPDSVTKVVIDAGWSSIGASGTARPASAVTSAHLAYAIYTSGSTGQPKGVLVEHRNVGNFFTGMDRVIDHDPPGVWLAVTSLSFDISVLEIFWTIARGFTVVIHKDPAHQAWAGAAATTVISDRPMQFGLFMWGNDDRPAPSKYDLMLRASEYFDRNGFDSVWTPERHFHAFGGPFPNPAVTGAALAVTTQRLKIRSGSCVSPLHHSIRIAEEWAVVDNLSNGRVGISFASGWQPNDFVIRPENFGENKRIMLEQIDQVRRLWRGETVEFASPNGRMVPVSTLPRPVQPELPFWITTAGNPDSYRQAGRAGANVLTHLLGQTLEEVAEKITVYREARREAGYDPKTGIVTLMLHTFVGDDDDEVRELVRQPMKDYLGASMKLVLGFAWSFPAFKRPGGSAAKMEDVDLSTLSTDEEQTILDFAFDRYFETSGLFGTVDTCLATVERCKAAGVDEIACLLDFGVEKDAVLASLPHLKQVRDAANPQPSSHVADTDRHSFAATVRRNRVTHLQCTPSRARMLFDDTESRESLVGIRHLMVGGEAFPPALAENLLRADGGGTITNMYGPTETTIWSSTHGVRESTAPVPIGRPIANTSMYVLDRYRQPLPGGVPGDLYIGGDGVTRGYHERPDLTSERFVPDPFRGDGARMYWTGDLAVLQPSGAFAFLGRIDNQVKVRGYRIELAEIEAALERLDNVRVAAAQVREIQGDARIVAYVVARTSAFDEADARTRLRSALPDYMVPSHFVVLGQMPLTPNGKIDRKALPEPSMKSRKVTADFVAPENQLEKTIATAWCATLGLERVGVDDNFFDVGGHSLLVVQLHRRMQDTLDQSVSLVDLYRFPTIRSLTQHLTADGSADMHRESVDRAKKRREVAAARRRGR